ncbi:MAG: hypothetical protein ACD_20C00104G0035 [uncultured bacterium]|nr:MAG: hypothetical protein ACD_20C00104G0035 [uncultured bacterium]
MGISIRNSQNYVIVDIHTSFLDDHMVGILRFTLYDLIKHGQINILLNMSVINSINSNILGCLVTAQKKCRKKGGNLCIYGVQPDVLMIFYIIRLDEYLNLYNNEIDALNNQNILTKRRLRVVRG